MVNGPGFDSWYLPSAGNPNRLCGIPRILFREYRWVCPKGKVVKSGADHSPLSSAGVENK